ncbi:Formylglycine-generating enzyme, required for sulfatase activity, containings SUMF1/FGE domain [Nostoc flagelliforme CCNUN1]|uniref:Formylglycine-generating enzyme, required for sulfatase activity, containings SUMF1/FGE domain n=1 Tax=Nostoc flagelliforme CCNUN1 TaxID=2038116 RepID=A0A2K8T5M9_9NOSO|nr:formylglycine-generating enzyme family protein [Nostoc flagelliforme]AUB42335.1 Formylglycine-generating enzyme, required for sulfatase activity, containings SUMF1/FGE domain [Nostoc flagelliforme CCNUN1]
MAGEKDKWWEDETEIAELIWCAAHLHRIIAPPSLKGVEQPEDLRSPDGESPAEKLSESSAKTTPAEQTEPRTPIATYPKNSEPPPVTSETRELPSSERASPIRVPDPFPLPKPAEMSKALLPIAKRVPGILANELDVDATVEQTAEANGLLMMAFRPPLERWFEVHLLIDRSPSMAFWGDLAEGVATLFRWQGFFRDVRVWQFETLNTEPRLFSGPERIEREIRSLIAPGRNRLFVVLTDTLGKAWHSSKAFAALAILGEQHPVAIAHVFPQTLWRRTALLQAILRPLVTPESGCANSMLQVGARLHTKAPLYRFPIFNLSSNHFTTWANFLGGSGGNSIQGVLIRQEAQEAPAITKVDEPELVEEKPEDLLREFLSDASPEARELAKVLAAVPLFPPVMRLAQKQFLPDSEHWHLAEVFFSGLLQRSALGPEKTTVPETWYEFKPGIRKLLLENSPVLRTAEIWRSIGYLIQHHYGSLRDFQALIPNPEGSIPDAATNKDLYFAEVEAAVLMTWGGEYARQAQELLDKVAAAKWQIESLPLIKTFEFAVTTISIIEDETESSSLIKLQPFEFEVAVIQVGNILEVLDEAVFAKTEEHLDSVQLLVLKGTLADKTYDEIAESISGKGGSSSYLANNVGPNLWKILSEMLGKKVTKRNVKEAIERWTADRRLTIHRHRQQAQYFIEDLRNNGVQLEMVSIPEGSFIMGSPQDEPERSSSESPQHQVTVRAFFMGKYTVTQAQWQAVASLPQINRKLNPNASRFKGANRPVDSVFWYDAVEFCDRLSQYTGKSYRLPSEAEWEYACRAGMTTPFHFGETTTSELANYNAEYTYGAGVKGTYREETTVVGSFGVANAFGLYDMHGNVWEWCLDDWHHNYEGAPTDGSAWFDDNNNLSQKQGNAVLRGGSWVSNPKLCRSASRGNDNGAVRGVIYDVIGFRVVCAAGRILQ